MAGSKNSDSRKLEVYLQRAEARNEELEATVRMLPYSEKYVCWRKELLFQPVFLGQQVQSIGGSGNVHQSESNYYYGGVFRPNEDPVH